MELFQKILLFSLIPAFTMIIGGVIATIRVPGGNIRSLILHFAAGVVFSVVAVELLPDIIKTHAPLQLIVGFSMGFLVMIAIRKLTEAVQEKQAANSTKGLPIGLLAGVAVDIFIDGLLLGIGFSAGNTEGILLTIALSVELLSLGMATAIELSASTGKKKAVGLIITLAAVFFISAALGATLLHNLSHKALEVVLSFGLAALLFLVTEELLTEAHEEKETVWHTAAFFGGFLLFLIFGMMA